uniref:Uncharacterized protein n=3 Tax=Micrurus TaxID=8634 RepID=A0A2D4G565_MICCO
MRSKELPAEIRDSIITRHRSGEGYNKISAVQKVPKSTMASITLKWKTFGTDTSNSWMPSQTEQSGEKSLSNRGDQEPDGCSELDLVWRWESSQKTTITATLHQSGLYSRVARWKPFLSAKHMKARLEFAKKHLKDSLDYEEQNSLV